MDGYAEETDDGLRWVDPMRQIARIAALAAEGMRCPKCGQDSKLFYGDPSGEHWCIGCQVCEELGLERNKT